MAAVIAYMRPVARVPYTAHSKSGCSQVLNSRADGTVAASRLIMALRAETLRDYRETSGLGATLGAATPTMYHPRHPEDTV